MSIDWTKPLVVAGTDRVATLDGPIAVGQTTAWVVADWRGNGKPRARWVDADGRFVSGRSSAIENAVTNAPPTPQTFSAQDAAALEGYRAATAWVASDAWDGCSDCIEVLRMAAIFDFERCQTPDETAHILAKLRAYDAGVPAPPLPVAPPTPQIGPEHIEALIVGVAAMFKDAGEWETAACSSENANYRAACWASAKAAEQRAARLAEIRAYLEPLTAQGGSPASEKDEA